MLLNVRLIDSMTHVCFNVDICKPSLPKKKHVLLRLNCARFCICISKVNGYLDHSLSIWPFFFSFYSINLHRAKCVDVFFFFSECDWRKAFSLNEFFFFFFNSLVVQVCLIYSINSKLSENRNQRNCYIETSLRWTHRKSQT